MYMSSLPLFTFSGSSFWSSNVYLKCTIFKAKLFIIIPQCAPSPGFPISGHGNFMLPVTQSRGQGVIIDSIFPPIIDSSLTISHPVTSFWEMDPKSTPHHQLPVTTLPEQPFVSCLDHCNRCSPCPSLPFFRLWPMWEPKGIFSMPGHIMSLLCPKPSNGFILSQVETQRSFHLLRGPHTFFGLISCQSPHPSLPSCTGLLAIPQTCQHAPTLGPRASLFFLPRDSLTVVSTEPAPQSFGLLGKNSPEGSIENSSLYHCFLYSAYFFSILLISTWYNMYLCDY